MLDTIVALASVAHQATLAVPHVQSVAPVVQADGGIIATLTTTTNQLNGLFKLMGALAIAVFGIVLCHKRGFGMGAMLGVFFVAGLAFFFMNGGGQWLGNEIQTTLSGA